MNKRNLIIIGIIVLIALVGTFFLVKKTTTTTVLVSQSDWKTYENTRYGYEILYPKGISIGSVQEEDPATIQTTAELSAGNLEIVTEGFLLSAFQSNSNLDRNKLSNKDVTSFTQALWQNEKDNPNPNIHREINNVTKITFASTTAYTFTEKQSGTDYARHEAITKGLSVYPWNKTYIFLFLENPNDGKIISISVTDDIVAQQMLKTFIFTHNNMAGIPSRNTWLTYENTTHRYRINYPPNSNDVQVYPYYDEYTRIRPSISNTIQIPTPRGMLGVWALTGTTLSQYDPNTQQDAAGKVKYLLSLDTKSFAEALCEEQAQRARKLGPDPLGYPLKGYGMCRIDKIQKGIVADQISYTLDISGRLDVLLLTVLVPGLMQEYKYTFFENKGREKFLVWYPANEPVFDEIVSSFKFTDQGN